MADTEGLLPCPFCGGDAETDSRHYNGIGLQDYNTGWAIYCSNEGCLGCPSFSKVYEFEEEATKAWNTRPTPQIEVDEAITHLEKSSMYHSAGAIQSAIEKALKALQAARAYREPFAAPPENGLGVDVEALFKSLEEKLNSEGNKYATIKHRQIAENIFEYLAAQGHLTPDMGRVREHPVFDFLLGKGKLEGCHYGEKPKSAKGNFWWRKHLQEALAALGGE